MKVATSDDSTRFLVMATSMVLLITMAFILAVPAHAAETNWSTSWSDKLGVKLEKTFDSGGSDAWDPKQHRSVFITTEGPGYGGSLSGVKLPGIVIYDAKTRVVVASRSYDVLSMGWKNVFEPHGLGVSSDGRWLYLPTGEGSFNTTGSGHLLIINARTLKLDKILWLKSNAHHAKAFRNADGKELVLVENFADNFQPTFILDPADDNKVVGGWDKKELLGLGSYLAFADPDGKEIYVGGRLPGRAIAIDPARIENNETAVVRIDTQTWKRKSVIPVNDGNVVWIAFSADNRWAYFSGAEGSRIFKYDREKDKVVAQARAGVEGPYGLVLDWRDQLIYAVGKGEGSHNQGKVLGVVDTRLMSKPRGDRPLNQYVTGCIRGDHATLFPEPDANEIWITCNASFEIVIFDLDQKKVTARLPTPNGGSTHSGAFVKYDGWRGEVTSDIDGLHGSALAAKRRIVGYGKGAGGK